MSNLDDTQPNRIKIRQDDGVPAPPKILLFGVIGLFLLVVVGFIAGIFVFREVLTPGQQQRVIDQFPFMEAFKRPTPAGGVLPTVPVDSTTNAEALNLLNLPLATVVPVQPAATQPVLPATTQPEATPVPATATAEPVATATPTEQSAGVPAGGGDSTSLVALPAQPQASSMTFSAASGLPATARIYGITHQQQTWNNCGPATLTMALSFYGWQEDQKVAAAYLKPNREDKNVSPHEMVNFVNEETGVRALMRVGGDIDLLKTLVNAQFPVVVETSAMFEAYDWLGHYRLLVAYDDSTGMFFFYDSFQGKGDFNQGVTTPYREFDADWQDFNRTFMVIYQRERETELLRLLGTRATEESAAQVAFDVARQEATTNMQDGHAWFNMGSSLVILGRYEEAANAFDQARRYDLPWRMLWYQFGPFEAYFNVGRYDDVLTLAQVNLNNAKELEETYYWRGRVYAARGQTDSAAAEFRQALVYNPNFQPAQTALASLR